MKLEEAIRIMEEWSSSYYKEVGENDDSLVIDTVLEELQRYKRLAEANLKDSEEFKNNMCKHRCVLKSELQELQENSISKKKIEDKIKELIKIGNYRTENNPNGRIHFRDEPCDYQIKVLQELLEDK